MRRLSIACFALLLTLAASAAGVVSDGSRNVKILGGAVAAPGQFPWMAALVDSSARRAVDGTFCGGTLIAPRVILTAAHCVEGTAAEELDAVLGRTQLSHDEDGQRIHVTRIVRYPDYDSHTVLGDVALLELAEVAPVAPLAIAHPAEAALAAPGSHVMTTGWGTTREGGRKISDELRFVRLVTRAHGACDRVYGPIQGSSQLCIGSPRAGEDTCQGDSGGPVLAGPDEDPRLVGTVSYGRGCGRKGIPGVYTRVSHYAAWIDEHAAVLNGDAVPPPVAEDDPVVRIGKISCGRVYCDVTLKTTGRAPAGGIVLNVVRKRSANRTPVDRLVFAKQLSSTRWRAHVNLPFGHLTLYAIPLNSAQDDLDGDGDVQRVQIYATR